MPVSEAEENLRFVRALMERSNRHSTFSGLSGVLAGAYCVAACLANGFLLERHGPAFAARPFLALWSSAGVLTIITHYLLTKRRAALAGKTVQSRLGMQILAAASPAPLAGSLPAGTPELDALDDAIHQKPRLVIMSTLMALGEADFRLLRETLGLTDGDLSTHLALSEGRGYVEVQKGFRGRKPDTTARPTEAGRAAFRQCLEALWRIVRASTGTAG